MRPGCLAIALLLAALPAGGLAGGCADGAGGAGDVAPAGGGRFEAASVRLHPIFTRPEDLDDDGSPDAVRVLLELVDQFGDRTKGSGEATFELYPFVPDRPGRRGERIGLFRGSLVTLDLQRELWNPQLRGYEFDLGRGDAEVARVLRGEQRLLLTVAYQVPGGGRLFDERILPRPR